MSGGEKRDESDPGKKTAVIFWETKGDEETAGERQRCGKFYSLPQHFLYFLPLTQMQGSLRPIFLGASTATGPPEPIVNLGPFPVSPVPAGERF